MTKRHSMYLKTIGGIAAILVAITALVGFASRGVEEKIDGKITEHEAVFEAEQQEQISCIREDISALKAGVDRNYEQGKHTQELVEQVLQEKQ